MIARKASKRSQMISECKNNRFCLLLFSFLLLLSSSLPAGCHSSDSNISKKGFSINIIDGSSSFVELDFSIQDYRIEEVEEDGNKYSDVIFDGDVRLKKTGYAALPYLHASIQIPPSGGVKARIISEKYVDIQLAHPFLPSKGALHKSQNPSGVTRSIDPDSLTNEYYPAETIIKSEPYVFRDLRGVNIYVYSFRYNAQQHVLRVLTNIRVAFDVDNTIQDKNALPARHTPIVREMDTIYKTVFINYGLSSPGNKMQRSLGKSIADFGEILVISTSRDSVAIKPYIEWKRQVGYTVHNKVVSTGTNVKSTIKSEYIQNPNILYVQLVGDWADIKSDLGTTNSISDRAADPLLGCVSGDDYYPELIIGRFSANSADHVVTQVDKTIRYEKNPDVSGTWYKKHLCISTSENVIFDDEREDGIGHSEIIAYDKLEKSTYTDTYFFTDKDNKESTRNAINGGVGVINYWGHGMLSGFVTTSFYKEDVNQLTNGNKLPFIFAGACDIGWFNNNTTSFAEVWLRKSGGGAVAALMASMSQWYDAPARGQDYMNDLLVGGYDYSKKPGEGISTSEGRTTFGSIGFNSLILLYTEDSSRESLETVQTWIVFGDASLQVRTDTPKQISISNSNVVPGIPFEATISSNGSAVKGARVTLSRDESVSTAVTDNAGKVSINHPYVSGVVNLVVTGFNLNTIFKTVTVAAVNNESPIAEFEFSIHGLQVQFSDKSTDPENKINSWSWNFGDGSSSTEKDPIHTYSSPGATTVTLTVTDIGGLTDSKTKNIVISDKNYQLTVEDGDGDGAYAEGQIVTITADKPQLGNVFDQWRVKTGNIQISDPEKPTTTLAMPAGDAIVYATYREALIIGCGSVPGSFSPNFLLIIYLGFIVAFTSRITKRSNKSRSVNQQ